MGDYMGRIAIGGLAALLLVAAGLFWWQSRAAVEHEDKAAPAILAAPVDDSIPEGDANAFGAAPPMPANASPQSREQRRFGRYDRNRDGVITREEMLSSRTKAFRKLDKDGNNLLSFEEWAVATADRFGEADSNKDGKLSSAEFAVTAPPVKAKAKCRC